MPQYHDRSSERAEDGVVAVVVALLLAVFLLFGALVLDVGSLFATRQDVVGDVDAAALAAAVAVGDHVARGMPWSDRCPSGETGPGDTQDLAELAVERMLDANPGSTSVPTDSILIECARLTVTVTGTQDVSRIFARGDDDLSASATSTAKYAPAVGGPLLPLSLCANNVALQSWLSAGAPVYGTQAAIAFGDEDEHCGDVPGNWAWLGSDNTAILSTWISDGMPAGSVVDLAPTCDIEGGDDPSDGWCAGAAGLVDPPLSTILDVHRCPNAEDDCVPITLVVHDDSVATGTNAFFEPIAFVDVAVIGQSGSGPDAQLIVEFRAYRDAPDEPPFTPSRSYLCSVDFAQDDHEGCDY